MPSASVIIPTYRRPEDLVCCLESLIRQDTADFEVIVVDNAADDYLRLRLDSLRGVHIQIRYVAEPALGMHNARHRGATSAASDLLLYVDDDAICAPACVRAYVTAFADYAEMAAAGGPILPRWDTDPDPWLVRFATEEESFVAWSLLDRGDEFLLGPDGVFFGANMAIRRDALFEAGGFNPEGFGDTWLGDGETGLLRELRRRESLIGWVPEARVEHRIPAERTSIEFFRRRASNEGAADAFTRYHPSIPPRSTLLKHAAWYLWRIARRAGRARPADGVSFSSGRSAAHVREP